MKKLFGLIVCLMTIILCCVSASAYTAGVYSKVGGRVEYVTLYVDNFTVIDSEGELSIESPERIIQVEDYVLENIKEKERFVLVDIKTDNAENPYPAIEPATVRLKESGVEGGVRVFGRDYRLFYVDNETQKATDISDKIISSSSTELEFSAEKTGKYIIYLNPDAYELWFYLNDPEPSDDSVNSEPFYKVTGLSMDATDIDYPPLPTKEGYVFTGWKAQQGAVFGFIGPEEDVSPGKYMTVYGSWCPADEYEPINIEISSSEPITKGNENGKKITVTTNYGTFRSGTDFPSDWRTEYEAATSDAQREYILSDWKSKWNIVGNDDIMVESAARIDDKTVELTLSGNSTDVTTDSQISVEIGYWLLKDEEELKAKIDENGIVCRMYCSDNILTLEAKPSIIEYTGYIDYDAIYDPKNYEKDFASDSVIVVMQPVEWYGSVDEYVSRGVFDDVDYAAISIISKCKDPSGEYLGDQLKITFNNGTCEKVLETIETLKTNEYVIYSKPNYIIYIDDPFQWSYADGKFRVLTWMGKGVISLYKDGALVDVTMEKEMDISKIDFDEMYLYQLSAVNPLKPLKSKIVLTKQEILDYSEIQ